MIKDVIAPKETNDLRPVISLLIDEVFQQTDVVQGIDDVDFKSFKSK